MNSLSLQTVISEAWKEILLLQEVLVHSFQTLESAAGRPKPDTSQWPASMLSEFFLAIVSNLRKSFEELGEIAFRTASPENKEPRISPRALERTALEIQEALANMSQSHQDDYVIPSDEGASGSAPLIHELEDLIVFLEASGAKLSDQNQHLKSVIRHLMKELIRLRAKAKARAKAKEQQQQQHEQQQQQYHDQEEPYLPAQVSPPSLSDASTQTEGFGTRNSATQSAQAELRNSWTQSLPSECRDQGFQTTLSGREFLLHMARKSVPEPQIELSHAQTQTQQMFPEPAFAFRPLERDAPVLPKASSTMVTSSTQSNPFLSPASTQTEPKITVSSGSETTSEIQDPVIEAMGREVKKLKLQRKVDESSKTSLTKKLDEVSGRFNDKALEAAQLEKEKLAILSDRARLQDENGKLRELATRLHAEVKRRELLQTLPVTTMPSIPMAVVKEPESSMSHSPILEAKSSPAKSSHPVALEVEDLRPALAVPAELQPQAKRQEGGNHMVTEPPLQNGKHQQELEPEDEEVEMSDSDQTAHLTEEEEEQKEEEAQKEEEEKEEEDEQKEEENEAPIPQPQPARSQPRSLSEMEDRFSNLRMQFQDLKEQTHFAVSRQKPKASRHRELGSLPDLLHNLEEREKTHRPELSPLLTSLPSSSSLPAPSRNNDKSTEIHEELEEMKRIASTSLQKTNKVLQSTSTVRQTNGQGSSKDSRVTITLTQNPPRIEAIRESALRWQ